MTRLFLRIIYYPTMILLRIIDMINPPFYMKIVKRFFSLLGIKMKGNPKYISGDVYFDDFSLIEFGDDVVVSKKVVFLTHDYSITTGLISIQERPQKDIKIVGNIRIGNNVFIGLGTTILPNTQIGDNCIIGARSVVKGIIPNNSVLIGNPAKIVMSIEDYITKKQNTIKSYTCITDKYKS